MRIDAASNVGHNQTGLDNAVTKKKKSNHARVFYSTKTEVKL